MRSLTKLSTIRRGTLNEMSKTKSIPSLKGGCTLTLVYHTRIPGAYLTMKTSAMHPKIKKINKQKIKNPIEPNSSRPVFNLRSIKVLSES